MTDLYTLTPVKAFMVFCGCPSDGCLLVYAENRNKAKSMTTHSVWDEWEYQHMNTRRMPDFDKYSDVPVIIEDNDDLPEGAPDFYAAIL